MLSRLLAVSTLVIVLASCATTNQNTPIGDWSGTLSFPGASLRLIFHITESDNGYSTTIESVDQGNSMIPADMIIDGDSITFIVESLNVEYVATISGNQIVGEFTQFGNSMSDFTITRNE